MTLKSLLSTLLICSLITLNAQDREKLSLDSGNVDLQFEYVIKKSNNYKEYKVIEKTWMNQLRAQVNDSLKEMRSNKSELESTIKSQSAEIIRLKSSLASTQDSLAAARSAKDEMGFLGTSMSKSGYSTMVWSIVAVLLVLWIVFVIRFRASNSITSQAKANLASVQDEFDQHRKRSLEREQKLRRELQDEINKQRRNA